MDAKRLAGLAGIALGLLSFCLGAAQAQVSAEEQVRWSIALPDALPIRGEHRSYVEQQSIRVMLLVYNESASPVLIDQAMLRNAVFVQVFTIDAVEIPTTVEWRTQVRLSTANEPIETDLVSPIGVEPNSNGTWNLSIERVDGRLFDAGQYGIVPTTNGFAKAVKKANGEPWGARAPDGSGTMLLSVMRPGTPRESSLMQMELALQALRRGDTVTAVAAYERAVGADATNHRALLDLAGVYGRAGRYRESIGAYEELLRRQSAAGAPATVNVLERLAFAHVAAGDETSAARVLRDADVPDDQIAAALKSLRQDVARAREQ